MTENENYSQHLRQDNDYINKINTNLPFFSQLKNINPTFISLISGISLLFHIVSFFSEIGIKESVSNSCSYNCKQTNSYNNLIGCLDACSDNANIISTDTEENIRNKVAFSLIGFSILIICAVYYKICNSLMLNSVINIKPTSNKGTIDSYEINTSSKSSSIVLFIRRIVKKLSKGNRQCIKSIKSKTKKSDTYSKLSNDFSDNTEIKDCDNYYKYEKYCLDEIDERKEESTLSELSYSNEEVSNDTNEIKDMNKKYIEKLI